MILIIRKIQTGHKKTATFVASNTPFVLAIRGSVEIGQALCRQMQSFENPIAEVSGFVLYDELTIIEAFALGIS